MFFDEDFNILDKYYEEKNTDENINSFCCSAPLFIVKNDTKDTICRNCGTFDFKAHIDNDDIDYNGNPLTEGVSEKIKDDLLPKSSMVTYIHGFSTQFSFLKQMHLYHRPTEERGLIEVFKKIDYIFNSCDLPQSLNKEAKYYYKELCDGEEDGTLTRGDIRSGLIMACIYMAGRNNNKPMDINILAKKCKVKKSIITRGLKRLSKIEKNKDIKLKTNIDDIHCYLENFCSKFPILNENDKDIIHLLYERCIKLNIIKNNTYKTICAGLICLYICRNNIQVTKRDISNIIDISEVTLNKIYNIFDDYSHLLFIGL